MSSAVPQTEIPAANSDMVEVWGTDPRTSCNNKLIKLKLNKKSQKSVKMSSAVPQTEIPAANSDNILFQVDRISATVTLDPTSADF